jgi:hypothetical protein
MSQPEKTEINQQQSAIEDLDVDDKHSAVVKGGRIIGVGELQETTISKMTDGS